MSDSWFSQSGYRCRLDWGRRGARAAAARGDLLVVVDVLRFSSAVIAAVERGGVVFPCAWDDDPVALAASLGAEMAGRDSRYSLSPLSYKGLALGTRIVLPSPNGATCSRHGASVPHLFLGALLNARAVSAAVNAALRDSRFGVTVLACGERWPDGSEDGDLRFAIEDYLGAGAILSYLENEKSPEANVCEAAFRNVASDLEAVVRECGSGRELRQKGRDDDVRFCAQLNRSDAVPVLRGGRFIAGP